MPSIEHGQEIVESDDFQLCKAEARRFAWLWVIQTAVMIGLFVLLGYYRSDDQLGFPLGMPTWYLFGCVLPALVFLVASIAMALRMKEVDLS